jgi:hypothetical protein
MSPRGPMSIKDHRAWVERNVDLLPSAPVKKETVARGVMRIAAALARSEQQLIDAIVSDCAYTAIERERVEEWAREAITLAASAVDGAAWNGTILSDNALFHPLAAYFSPMYAQTLESTYARIPSEMKPTTLMRAREDIKAAGLRLQQIHDLALRGAMATCWYEAKNTMRGRRARPLEGAALDEKRAELRLPPLDRHHSVLLRADDPPRFV